MQSLREDVLKAVNRGHSLKDTIDAFRFAKDSCFKVVAHMMPGLPKSDPDKDLEDLLTLVEDEKYKTRYAQNLSNACCRGNRALSAVQIRSIQTV